jgi:Ser/Thr protein kinase RdoA (MazF antagonist)
MLFEIAPGQPVETTSAGYAAAYGAGLARIHEAAADYTGADSRYRLDLDHLLRRPLAEVLRSPNVDAPTRAALGAISADLEDRFAACETSLSAVHCHGDCHGGNAHVVTADGAPVPTFFDFDDGGPGFLAYDLAVFLWSAERRRGHGADATQSRTSCSEFLQGYRSVRAIPAADLAATALFVPIRQVWIAGEFAGRIHHWGVEAFQREVAMIPRLAAWAPGND